VQNDDGYRGLHDERGAVKHLHLPSLSWNASDPKDERSAPPHCRDSGINTRRTAAPAC